MRLHLVLAATLLIGTMLDAHRLEACSCAPESAEDQIQDADLVFRGTVVEVGEAEPHACAEGEASFRPAVFSVTKVWKGEVPTTWTVHTSAASCGYPFRVGQEWIVLAHGVCGLSSSSMCAGSAPIEHAESLLAALEPDDAGPHMDGGTEGADDPESDGEPGVDAGNSDDGPSVACRCVGDAETREAVAPALLAGLLLGLALLPRRRRGPPRS